MSAGCRWRSATAFASLQPRDWYRADEHGSWVGARVVGGDSLLRWLEHFGGEHGLGISDLDRFGALAGRRRLATSHAYIYSQEDIVALLAAAGRLKTRLCGDDADADPAAVTGMRIGEASRRNMRICG
jgi:integrase